MSEEIYYRNLVDRYRTKKASDDELMVFFHLLQEGKLDEHIGDAFLANDIAVLHEIAPVKRMNIWPRVAIAASVVALISLVLFFFMYEGKSPGGEQALAGKKTPAPNATFSHTVSTKRGQQTQFVLPDGTKVWLNAASSLRYPPSFSNTERLVELEGEGYFEVVKNASAPFKVKTTAGIEIRVLGTHFNVYAYDDEPVSATLLEGSIQLQSQNASAVLRPGEKALVDSSGKLAITSGIDPEDALAWKNGVFQFNKADILTVMSQIEKWYDVEVVYEGQIPDRQFVGRIPRSSDLSEVLDILRLSKVNLRMEGKKIIVMP